MEFDRRLNRPSIRNAASWCMGIHQHNTGGNPPPNIDLPFAMTQAFDQAGMAETAHHFYKPALHHGISGLVFER